MGTHAGLRRGRIARAQGLDAETTGLSGTDDPDAEGTDMSTGGGQTSTSTSNSAPWSGQQPYLTQGFQQAQNLYNSSSPQYYPGSTVAAQSPQTQAYQQAASAIPGANAGLENTTSNYLQNVMSPSYMNAGSTNSGAVYNDVASHVLPSVNSQFSAGGRYGYGAQGASA